MPKYKALIVLPFSLLVSGLTGGPAYSQVLPPPFIEYAAKFACGPAPADSDVVTGQYASSINIHNPQATIAVKFLKKIVAAFPEGTTPPQPVTRFDTLGPDLAERVDCPVIFRLLNLPSTSHVEGFVVLEVPTTTGAPQPVLDVVGKYTARSRSGEVSSFDVVNHSEKSIVR